MKMPDGSNTISDERYHLARYEMYTRHDDEYEVVHNGSGRSEELPSELHARQTREWKQLEHDYETLNVQQWLKRHPDEPALKRHENQELEQRYNGSIFGSAEHAERQADEYEWDRALRAEYADQNTFDRLIAETQEREVGAAEDRYLSERHRGAQVKLINGGFSSDLILPENRQRATESIAAAQPSHTFTEGKNLAQTQTPRDRMNQVWQRRELAAQATAPAQQQGETQRQSEQQRQGQTQRLRPTLVQ